jgi:hypothetical protein
MTNKNIEELSTAEKYVVGLENPEPGYYSRIPHILSYLTYDYKDPKTGKTSVKKLSLQAKELYRVLKQFAGEHSGQSGACWTRTEILAELTNMSMGSVSNAKKELQQSFHQIDGKPLIIIEKRKRHIKNVNATEYHKITVVTIWNYNNAFNYAQLNKKQINYSEALSPHESAQENPEQALSPHESAPQALSPHEDAGGPKALLSERALSPHETNNKNKNQLYKEQQPVANATADVLKINNRLFVLEAQGRAYQWLINEGCEEKLAHSIAKKYTPEDIGYASKYQNQQRSKPGFFFKKDRWAHFQNILTWRYWEKQ